MNGFILRWLFRLLCCVVTLFVSNAIAEEPVFPKYLEGNEPSYFVYVPRGESSRRDAHFEFYLSVRYPIADEVIDRLWFCGFDLLPFYDWYGCMKEKGKDAARDGGDNKIYFVYNGQYDFFAGTRDSSPLVSRRQNPGLTYQYTFAYDNYPISRLKLSWFHESNGQYLDEDAYNDALANGEDILQLHSKYGLKARDHISRGWDYAELALEEKWSRLEFAIKYRNHCNCQAFGFEDKEDKIFWDLSKDSDGGIREFRGTELSVAYTVGVDFYGLNKLRFGYTVWSGEAKYIGKNITQKALVTLRFVELPITFFYFDGYGEDLAQYHESTHYVGVGLEIW